MLKIIMGTLMLIAFQSSLQAGTEPTLENTTKLYVATFNRAPDAGGLNYWAKDAGLNLEGIALSFFDQPETQTLYPSSGSNRDFIKSIYSNLFNRDPDTAGLDYWESELSSGRIPKSTFILAVVNGALGDDAVILENKKNVGIAYAEAGLNDVQDAKDVMLNVTADLQSVEEAKGLIADIVIKKTIMCMSLETIELLKDVNGAINMEPFTNHVACYRVYLSSNNGSEKYAFYMNLYEGTINNDKRNMNITIYDDSGVEVKKFSTGRLDEVDSSMSEQFNVSVDGNYYIKIERDYDYAAKYGFSIHPSNENGLVHDDEGELNDFKSMATPLTLLEAQNDVVGTLNITRVQDSSIKGTDKYDFYEIDFDRTGTFALYVNLYEGTRNDDHRDTLIELRDDRDVLVKQFSTGKLDEVDSSMSEEFSIPSTGKYYLRLNREYDYAAKYGFSIQLTNENGLVHDAEGELNDFASMATPLTLLEAQNDVVGTLNITRVQDSSIKGTDKYDFYEIDFDRTGTFALYVNLYEGTRNDDYRDTLIELRDDLGVLVKQFSTGKLDEVDSSMSEQFSIPSTGKYYLRLNREYHYATKYGFSITRQ